MRSSFMQVRFVSVYLCNTSYLCDSNQALQHSSQFNPDISKL